jgi:ParB-like chromosome segregation protein Spo0J
MKITVLNISELVTPEKNIRIHTDKQIKEFVRSINMFGQIRPAVVDENNVILAGNGLVEALKAAGKTEVEVYKIENLTENQKKKLMIADNKIFG